MLFRLFPRRMRLHDRRVTRTVDFRAERLEQRAMCNVDDGSVVVQPPASPAQAPAERAQTIVSVPGQKPIVIDHPKGVPPVVVILPSTPAEQPRGWANWKEWETPWGGPTVGDLSEIGRAMYEPYYLSIYNSLLDPRWGASDWPGLGPPREIVVGLPTKPSPGPKLPPGPELPPRTPWDIPPVNVNQWLQPADSDPRIIEKRLQQGDRG